MEEEALAAAGAAVEQQLQQPAAEAAAAAMGLQAAAEACGAVLTKAWPPTVDWDELAAHVRALGGFALQCRDSLHEALLASWVAAQAWWRVIVLLGTPVLRLLLRLWRLALPHLKWTGQKCFDHLKEQEPEVLLGYAAFVALLVGLALLRRLLRRLRVYDRLRQWAQARVAAVERQYQRTTNKLRQYSRRAAEAFPHLLFLLLALGATWLFPAQLHAAASREVVFNILLLYLPALATFLALQQQQQQPPSLPASKHKPPQQSIVGLQGWLPFWVVAAGVLSLKAAAEQLWLRWLARLVPWGGELALFFALWLHVPQAGGALIQQHLRPFLHRRLQGLMALQAKRDAAVGGLLRVAVFARLLSQPTADRLAAHVDELLLVVPAAVLTLSPLAGWGLLFISLLYPAYATVRAMSSSSSGGGAGLGGIGVGVAKQQPPGSQSYPPEPWLRYWVVFALSHLLFQALPFWSVIQMWYYLWVLLPHLDGLPFIVLDGRNRVFNVLSQVYQEGGGGGAGQGGKQQQPQQLQAAKKVAAGGTPRTIIVEEETPLQQQGGKGGGGLKQQQQSPEQLRRRAPGSPKRVSPPPPSSPKYKQQQQQQEQERAMAAARSEKDE